MFFEIEPFVIEDMAVFRLQWEQNKGLSELRPYHSLSFRVRGDAVFTCEGETVRVKTGEMIFIPAYHQYRIESGEEELFVVHFTIRGNVPQRLRAFTPGSSAAFQRLFEELYDAWLKKRPGYLYECRGRLYRLIARLEEEASEAMDAPARKISVAQEYIHAHFTDQSLTVGFLAELCGISETYFRRLFQQRCGAAPLEYINRLRLNHALELLTSGYYTVAETAELCGFSSPYYFSAFIKKQTGSPPLAFLKR